MARITRQLSANGVPLVGPTSAPQIFIWRLDTGAIVVNAAALSAVNGTVDLGVWQFNFSAINREREYAFVIDADPNSDNGVSVPERFYEGNVSGITDHQTNLLLYGGVIWIDPNNGTAGDIVGVNGTPSNPVDNLADAAELSDQTGFQVFRIVTGTITLDRSFNEAIFIGGAEVTIEFNGQNVNGSEFEGATLRGVMTGVIGASRCLLEDITGLRGSFHECGLDGTNVMGVGQSTFHHGFSSVPGLSTPAVDFNGAGVSANFRSYSGGIRISGMNDASNIASVDFVSGQLIVDADCTDGVLVARGIGDSTDNSTGTTVVLDDLWPNVQRIRDSMMLGPTAGSPAVGSIDDDLDIMKGAGFVTGTDSLEAIRDRGDAAWAPGPVVKVSAITTAGVPSTVRLLVVLERDGQVVVASTGATISLKNPDGTIVIASAAMTGPNADGVFLRDVAGVTLADVTNYYADVAVTDAVGTVRQLEITPTIGG